MLQRSGIPDWQTAGRDCRRHRLRRAGITGRRGVVPWDSLTPCNRQTDRIAARRPRSSGRRGRMHVSMLARHDPERLRPGAGTTAVAACVAVPHADRDVALVSCLAVGHGVPVSRCRRVFGMRLLPSNAGCRCRRAKCKCHDRIEQDSKAGLFHASVLNRRLAGLRNSGVPPHGRHGRATSFAAPARQQEV